MHVLRPQEVADHFKVSIPTIYNWVRESGFPKPVPLAPPSRIKVFLESEIDAWIAARAAARPGIEHKREVAPGRRRFWEEVKAGLRPHPRTAGRLKREAAGSMP